LKNKRRNHSAQFKVKVALAAAKGQKTIAELAKEYNVHPTQIVQWKKHLMDSLPEIFSVRRKKAQQEQELLTNELYQQIGQLKVELDWLKKKSGYDTLTPPHCLDKNIDILRWTCHRRWGFRIGRSPEGDWRGESPNVHLGRGLIP
jgi:transposase